MDSNAFPRVLLVEDSDNDVVLFRAAVASVGVLWLLEFASDGRQVVEALVSGPPPAAVILDLGLPDMSGLEVLAWAQAKGPPISDIPMCAYSATVDPAREEAALALGAVRFQRKSGEFEDLRRMVRYVDQLIRTAGVQGLSAG